MFYRLDIITESEDQQSFLGKRHLISFLSWLDYCDQLIGVANPYVAKSLSKSIRETFLDVIMEPSLLQTSETGAVLATAYLTRCLRTVCSHPLLAGMNINVPSCGLYVFIRVNFVERLVMGRLLFILSVTLSLLTLDYFTQLS